MLNGTGVQKICEIRFTGRIVIRLWIFMDLWDSDRWKSIGNENNVAKDTEH